MSESRKDVQMEMVDYICDSCLTHTYSPTGIALMSNPMQYEHMCTNCVDKRNLKEWIGYITDSFCAIRWNFVFD